MTKNDKAVLMFVGAVALVIYLVHVRKAGAVVQPALSPPMPVNNSPLLLAPGNSACENTPNPLTDPMGYADYIVTGGAECSE